MVYPAQHTLTTTPDGNFFLNKNYETYSWVEMGWITFLWEFVSQVKLTFSYPSAWRPPLPWQDDIFLIDFFISLRVPHKELEALNHCRLYLQVLTLSDIVAANARFILIRAKDGVKDSTRVSCLRWPEQGRPTSKDWATWRSTLSELESHGRLKSPLGNWVSDPHQPWVHFMDDQSGMVYLIQANSAQCYRPILHYVRTRAGPQCWIDTSAGQETCLIPEVLLPATLTHQSQITGSLASVVYSSNTFPVPVPAQLPSSHAHSTFYQRQLEGVEIPIEEISKAALTGKLVISTFTTGGKSSSDMTGQWAFHTHVEIYSVYRPYPQDSKYCAELYSLLTAIYILEKASSIKHKSQSQTPPQPITISVSQKKILTRVLTKSPLGIKDTVQVHYDLIVEIRHLLSLLDIPFSPIHIPGQRVNHSPSAHKTGEPQHSPLSNIGNDSEKITTNLITIHHGEVITEGLDREIHHDINKPVLKEKLQKDNNWTEDQFASVAWEEYHVALRKNP
jgi:hypothetical protein